MAAVELQNVSKSYGKTLVVDDLSLRLEHGEFVALLGPSGCGKTTTLQMIAGFVALTRGEIFIDSRPMSRVPPHKRNIGVVFQSYALFPHLSVFENVGFGLSMRGMEKTELATRVRRALDLVQLQSLEKRFPRELSGGQQQRVALARALVIEPSVLLLDEPLSNLDAELREHMRYEIKEIQNRLGITTLFVTHDQAEAMATADKLVLMKEGKIRQVGTARQIYDQPADAFVARFIGQTNLLRGTVVDVTSTRARVRIANAGEIEGTVCGAVKPGGEAILAIRPEAITIATRQQPGVINLPALVRRVSFLGATINVGVQVGDVTLSVATTPSDTPVPEGRQAFVTWSPTAGMIYPPDQ